MSKAFSLGRTTIVAFFVLGLVSQTLAAQDRGASITNGLDKKLKQISANAMVDVLVEMKHQVSELEIAAAHALPTKKQRRAAVVAALKNTAAYSQSELLMHLRAAKAKGAVEFVRPLWIHNIVAVRANAATVKQIARRADVNLLAIDTVLGSELFPIEPDKRIVEPSPGAGQQIECGVLQMGAPDVWNQLGFDGSGVTVAVIDSGVCFEHPDLAGREWINEDEIPDNGIDDDGNGQVDDIHGWNFRDDNSNFADDNSHGTHCSGTVAGTGVNGIRTGMAPGASIMAVKMWGDFAGESVAMNCVQYAANNDADVISSSWGWPIGFEDDHGLWRTVMNNVIATGVVTIFAAGNERGVDPPLAVRIPGDVPDVITVGATDCNDNLAGFSSPGPVTWETISPWFDWPLPNGLTKPDVSAPGVDTTSTYLWEGCDGYIEYSGTSMACPHVAGAAALMLSKNPELEHFDVKDIMMTAVVDLGAPGMDNDFGAGRLNAFLAVQLTPSPTITIVPNSHTVVSGSDFGGATTDLSDSDDIDLSVTRSSTSVQSLIEVDLETTSSIDSPESIVFTFESSVFARNDVIQTISMYNFQSSSFVELDSRNASRFTDGLVTVTIDTDASSFVEAATGQVLARIRYQGSPARMRFTASMDQAMWVIAN